MANLVSTDMAKLEELEGKERQSRAADIMKDACRIEPKTAEGAMLRQICQQQASRITSTNETWISRYALMAKNALNKITPGFPIGNLIMPIAKIPANILANGIENAGAGMPVAIKDIFKGHEKMQSEDKKTRYEGMAQYASGIQRLMRMAGVIGVAALLANQLKDKDFKTDRYGNHFIKMGNVWINMEYVNAISPALSGMMYAKIYGKHKGLGDKAALYAVGTLRGMQEMPGIHEASDLITNMTNTNVAKGAVKYMKDFFSSRGEPVFIKNLLRDRPINRLFFGAQGVETKQDIRRDEITRAENARKAKYGK